GQFKINMKQALNLLFIADKRVLSLAYDQEEIIRKYELQDMLTRYDLNDLMVVEKDRISLWFDVSDVNKQIAKNNIEIFILVLFILAGIMIFYSRHFIKYLALPLDAIGQKITDPSYSPQLEIKKAYKEDEVYEILNNLQKKSTSTGVY
ncbi:MAG: hypothetical protein KKH98_02965, partial [Spirochaetes bacterium]|nr:hypothetical protein [Spirochaetota bacterium]